MANYDAQINILVAGQRNIQNLANQLNAIEDSIGQIERRWRSAAGALQRANIRLGVTGTQQPRGEGGRFARDPDRRARQLAFQDRRRALIDQRLARLAVSRERAQAVAARSSIDSNQTLIRQTERRIILESRLNSANELFQRRLQQLSRGGGGRGLPQELQDQARSIQSAYQAAGGAASRNVRLIQSLATELGRVVERQNEFNRLQSLGSKGFEAGRRLQERITSAASGVDLPAQRVRNARSLAAQVISASRSGDQQAYNEAVRRATAATSRLERESKELADAINEQESEIRRIARIAPRSPVRGGRNFPGSPIAEEIALREAQKGFPASPIRGTATMAGSPKAIAAQERAAKIQRQAALAAERSAQKTIREAQKGYPSSPVLGATSMEGSPRWMAAQEKARSAAERALKAQERAAKIAENTANREAEKALRESQKGYPASPIAGTVSMTGSPRWLAAQEKARSAAERRVAAQRRTEERAAKVQQQIAAAAERAADKALREAQKGYPSSPVLGAASIKGSPRWKAAQESARQKLEKAAIAIDRAAEKALREARKGYPSSPILGTATMVGSPKAIAAQQKAQEIALKQSQRGFPASPIGGTATMPGSPKFLAAQERARSAAERALRAQEKSAKAAESAANKEADRILKESQKGFPSSPIMGTATMAGSPKAIAAQERNRVAAERRAAAQRRAEERAAKVQQQVAIAAERAADKALREAQKGFPSSPILGSATIEGSPRWKTAQESARQKLESAARAAERAADRALKEAQKGFPSSPILGTATMVGSPKWKSAQEKMARMAGGSGAAGSGLEQALKRLEEARGARQAFLGGASPAEAIDKIVREFNKSASGGGDQGAAQAAENVVGTYAQRITAGVPAVADAMMKLGKAGIDAIKKALGIASPSKVMLAIARNQIDTYVDFLRAAIPAVEAAAKAVGEAGAPKTSGVPEDAIIKPLTERARTRPTTPRDLEIYGSIAEYAASVITGPTGPLKDVKQIIEDFIIKTKTSVDLDDLFGGQADERFFMSKMGRASLNVGPEFDKARAALADFYQVPVELTPDLERGTKAASSASASADELAKYVSELTSGIEQIGVFLQSAAKLPTPSVTAPAVVDEDIRRAQEVAAKADAAAAEAARKKAEAQKPFEASIQRAAELDAEAKRKADAAVSSVVQAQIEADAKAGAEAISKSILDPIESAAPEGERQVRSAIGNLFDRVAGALGFGGGGGGRPPVPPTGGGGPTRDPGDFSRRLSTAAEQGAEALLGLQELRDPTKATTVELEALSNVLKEFRKILDPTVEGFDRLEKQLRESAANLDRQLERRAPDAGFLTRKFDPRVARGLSEGLIGGAFPLLFGQGLGAAVGGAAGGFGGGFAGGGLGFGLSLVGTALGTAFDTAVQSAIELGAALEKPVENFDQLAQKSFFSSKALEDTIKKTIEYGDTATASALIQEEAIKKLGVGGVQNLKVLGTESDRLNRAFAELGQQMQAVAAGPLASVIGFFANIAGQAAAAGRVRLLRANLNEQQAGQFNKEILGRLKERGIQRGFFAPSTPTESEVGILAQQGALQDIVDKWQAIQIKGKVKLDPKQKIESEINALQKRLEAMDLGKSLLDQVRSVNREQEDLDKQRADLVRSYEESIGNIRKQVEDKIADERRKNAQLELDIRAAAADLQLEKIKEANREFRGIFSDTLAGQTTERILDAVETITQIQNDGASQRANLELQIQNTAIETEKYKVEIANQVAKLNEETARRVDDINLSVRRRNEEYDQNRFTLEKRIAELQLKNNEILTTQQLDTAKKQLEAARKAGDAQQQAYAKTFVDIYQSQLDIVQKGQQEVGAISAPSKLKGVPVGVVGGGSVGTSGIDQAVNSGIRLQQALQGVQEQIRSVNSASALVNIEESLNKQIRQAELLFFEFEMGGGARSRDLAAQGNLIDAINAKLGEQQDKMSPLSQRLKELLQFEDGRFKIIKLINEATAADTQVKTLEDLISKENELKILLEEAKRGSQGLSEVDRTRLVLQQAGLDVENDKVRAILDQAAAVDALNEKYKKLTADQQMQKELLDGIAGTFANTVGGAIDAAVGGTENFGEALKGLAADMLKTIGRMLMMYAIAQALGALGGNDGVGFFSTLARGFGFRESANGSYFDNGIAAFAKGGMFTNSIVSSPTLFQFADGGVTRTGLMGEAGPEAIMPLERGPDGKLGIAAHFSENRQAMKGGSSGEPASAFSENRDAMSATATVERERMFERVISSGASSTEIKYSRVGSGDLPFVTEEDMLQASRIAAQEGARLGQQRTLAALKNNPGTRRAIGV